MQSRGESGGWWSPRGCSLFIFPCLRLFPFLRQPPPPSPRNKKKKTRGSRLQHQQAGQSRGAFCQFDRNYCTAGLQVCYYHNRQIHCRGNSSRNVKYAGVQRRSFPYAALASHPKKDEADEFMRARFLLSLRLVTEGGGGCLAVLNKSLSEHTYTHSSAYLYGQDM